jgi:hypothetical protein
MNPPRSETEPGQFVTWGKSTICSVDAFGYKFSVDDEQAHPVRLDRSMTKGGSHKILEVGFPGSYFCIKAFSETDNEVNANLLAFIKER